MSAATSATGQVAITVTGYETPPSSLIASIQPLTQSVGITLSFTNNSSGSGTCDLLYTTTGSLASTTTTLNFNSGLKSPFNESLVFARIRCLIIQNNNTATLGQDLQVYQGASNGVIWVGATSGSPDLITSGIGGAIGGIRVWYDGQGTGATTGMYITSSHCNLTLNSGSNTISYTVLAFGNSVA